MSSLKKMSIQGKDMHPNVQSSIIYNSQNMEATLVFINVFNRKFFKITNNSNV